MYWGVALTTLATLLLELALTRIFSVIFYYHLAFLAISIALFGLGAGGVFSYVVAGWRGSLFGKLGTLAAANSVAVVLSLIFLLSVEGEPGNLTLALVYFASAVPFTFSGAIVSLAISETVSRVDRVYFFDLLGAAGGCLLLVPFLDVFGGQNTLISVGVLFAASSSVWFNLARNGRGRAAGAALALVIVALMIFNIKRPMIDVKYAKGQKLQGERYVKWNSFSRIAVAPEPGSTRMSIVIDADAATGIAEFDFDKLTKDDREGLLYQGMGFPYVLRPGAKTLIIGPGGGWDVSRALASGSKDITGVEINPIIAEKVMKDRFADLSKRLYFRPEVRIVVEDGRAFVRRSTEKYQVIQATLVDTWASTAAGAFALSENNLYTSDAFRDYLAHLTDDGILVFTRWGFEPPRESLRLLTLADTALAELGETQTWKHVIVLREDGQLINGWGARDTVLISRKPFTAADIDRTRSELAGRIPIVYLPGDRPTNAFGEYLRTTDPAGFLESYRFDVTSVDDNRPFFFYTVQPRDLWEFVTSMSRDSADYKINRAVPLLFGLMGVSLAATALVLVLPPLMLGTRLPVERGIRRYLLYFVCLGAGYILIQVALIQKFVLFLGHPTYALVVIVFAMLVSSGAGSYMSRRLVRADDGRLQVVLGSISALVALLAVSAGVITDGAVGWPLWVKMAVSVVMIAPAGFCMGIPFPAGLARLEGWHKPSVRWAWSLNSASSVLGSASAIFLAIYLGLREAMLIGAALYVAALLLIRGTARTRLAGGA